MRLITTAALAALVALPAPLAAQDAEEADLPPSVVARHNHMNLYAFNLGQLGAMAKGEMPYDAEMASELAQAIVLLADIPEAGYWPEGTAAGEVPDSRALPAIWENFDDFMQKRVDLQAAAVQFQGIAGDGQQALGGGMQALGGACGACHKVYRQPDD